MELRLLFWILMLFWVVFNGWHGFQVGPAGFVSWGGSLLGFFLFVAPGWKVFGAPIQ